MKLEVYKKEESNSIGACEICKEQMTNLHEFGGHDFCEKCYEKLLKEMNEKLLGFLEEKIKEKKERLDDLLLTLEHDKSMALHIFGELNKMSEENINSLVYDWFIDEKLNEVMEDLRVEHVAFGGLERKITYKEMKEKHQKENSAFPFHWVFSKEDLENIKKELGVEAKDLVSVGMGGIMKKEDLPKFKELSLKHAKELAEALKNEEFAYEAFVYEASNHEYGYTGDSEEVFSSLGLDLEQVINDTVLSKAWEKASQKFKGGN